MSQTYPPSHQQPTQSPAVPDHCRPPLQGEYAPFDIESGQEIGRTTCSILPSSLEGSERGWREAKGSLHIAVNILNEEETFPR